MLFYIVVFLLFLKRVQVKDEDLVPAWQILLSK